MVHPRFVRPRNETARQQRRYCMEYPGLSCGDLPIGTRSKPSVQGKDVLTYIVSYRIGWSWQELEKDKLNITIGDAGYSELASPSSGWQRLVENGVTDRPTGCVVNVSTSGKWYRVATKSRF